MKINNEEDLEEYINFLKEVIPSIRIHSYSSFYLGEIQSELKDFQESNLETSNLVEFVKRLIIGSNKGLIKLDLEKEIDRRVELEYEFISKLIKSNLSYDTIQGKIN